LIIERNLIISTLKLTRNGPVLFENIKIDSRALSETSITLLEKYQSENLLKLNNGTVEVEGENRLKLASRAISLGADIEVLSNFLSWHEFESFAATALTNSGYAVNQNLRFKFAGRRWEADVVGCKRPLVVCLDCKSWHHGLAPSVLRHLTEKQAERTRELADALPSLSMSLKCAKWKEAVFVPALLVLAPTRFKFCDGVPIVPVLQLSDFLVNLPVEMSSLKYFRKEFAHLSHDS